MKKSVLIYTLGALLLGSGACHDQLNALPEVAKVDGNAIIDTKSAQTALNGAYYRFARSGTYNSTPSTLWLFNEEFGAYLNGTGYNGLSDLLDNAALENNLSVLDTWSYGYQLVNAANGVIKGVSALSDAQIQAVRKSEILGEAYFLRAYGHYMLLSYFGQYNNPNSTYGIILRKEFVTSENLNLPRNTVAECYEHILNDVDFAIANCKKQSPAYYASSWTAKALKARILMNRGATGDYSEVIQLTKDIINNGPYQLEANSKDLFTKKGLDSEEVILGIQPMLNQKIKQLSFTTYVNVEASEELVAMLQNDPRANWYYHRGNLFGRNVIYFDKFTGTQIETSYAFRLTEMYLLEAEAIARTGGDLNEARTLLKTVLKCAGFQESDQALLDLDSMNATALTGEIIKETRKNTCFEGFGEWLAFLRLPVSTIQQIRPVIKSKDQLTMPVPKLEMDKNNAMIQNPGYGN